MANSTIAITFKLNSDDVSFKNVGKSVENMRKALEGTIEPAERLRTSFINFAATAASLQAIGNAVGQLNTMVQDLVQAYAIQEEAETKLETVMRQRMNATDAEIQKMKELASAQQEIGVIGDEVQLAGMQQIATFLKTQEALSTLVPAMNNLVAQQKGLNASQGDMVAIANLMGKAMTGQTSALRRVGITFTEAEEKAIKYGTEQERAAALAKVITNNVGEMNAELAKTDSGRAQQMANAFGDIKEQLGATFKTIAPYLSVTTQIVSSLNAVMTLTNAFKQLGVGVGQATVPFNVFGKTIVATTTATKIMAVTWRTSMLAMKTALISTGIGAAIWALGEAISFVVEKCSDASDKMDDMTDSMERQATASEKISQSTKQAREQLALTIAELENFNGSKEEEAKKLEEVNSAYGDVFGTYNTLADWYDVLTKKQDDYVRMIELEAKARVLANKMTQAEDFKYALTHNPDGSLKKNVGTRIQMTPGPDGKYRATPLVDPNSPEQKLLRQQNAIIANTKKELAGVMAESAKVRESLRTPLPAKQESRPSVKPTTRKSTPVPATQEAPAPEGSIKWLEEQISAVEVKIKVAPTEEAAIELTRQRDKLQKELDKKQLRIKVEAGGGVKALDSLNPSLDTALPDLGNSLNPAPLSRMKREIKEAAPFFARLTSNVGEMGKAFRALGGAVDEGTAKWLNFTAATIEGIARILPELAKLIGGKFASAMAVGTESGAALPFPANIGAIASIVATIAGVMASVPKFAEGGLAYGPTLGLFGEYAGASNNPEVVAPLSRLQGILADSMGAAGGEVVFRIKGDVLEGVLANTTRIGRKAGRRSGIRL